MSHRYGDDEVGRKERCRDNKEEALTHVSEEIFRMWAIYLAGTSLGFANGGIHIVQVLASKKSKGPSGLPLTRADLYR